MPTRRRPHCAARAAKHNETRRDSCFSPESCPPVDPLETFKAIGMSLGLTFPFNILVGIPLYVGVAQRVLG